MRTPPLGVLVRVVDALQRQGLTPALGGSGLLVALGLAETANDWDITVDADDSAVTAALDGTGLAYHNSTEPRGRYATGQRYVIDAHDHSVDLLVNFALDGPYGIERLPTRVTDRWRDVPLADPAVWARAYRLLDRPAKADALERWLAEHPGGSGTTHPPYRGRPQATQE